MVHQPVHRSQRHGRFDEDLAPLRERRVGRDRQALVLVALGDQLEQLIELDQLPDLLALTQLLAPPKTAVPDVVVLLPALADYDQLIEVSL